MTFVARIFSWLSLLMALLVSPPLLAQGLRLNNALSLNKTAPAPASDGRTVDFIVALVNSEPVTNNDVRQRMLRVEQQLTQQGVALPPRDELARQVMELLVSEKAQIQDATEQGLRIDDATLEQAEQSIAAQNQLSLEEFRRRVTAQGMDLERFRSELRNQLLLRRVRDRETERIRVSNSEIDGQLKELNARYPDLAEVNLSHVLVKVPHSADSGAVQTLQAKAQSVADRAKAGEDFAGLAREFSEASEASAGGSFGWRAIGRLPPLFVQSIRGVAVGGVAGPIRSPAGWHILKVVERRQGVPPELTLVQSHPSHILLRPTAQMGQTAALARLAELREQVVKGQATFESLAQQFSQDGSASQGGDLGWVSPGQFVPEFETVMDALKPGELSQPVMSRFGAHLIRLNERREVPMTTEQQREAVRNVLREKKVDESLQTWMQDVRSRAYVEFRDAPRP